MVTKKPTCWAIVHDATGRLVIFDGRCPIYWLRRVARQAAHDYGYVTAGPDPDVRLVRVSIAEQRS